mmetsp:Transcript_21305/g.23802  ORF Transcript_21305/g.23802 Transcript_21305/m.23802 type:complete len:149 (-) Transcript_21305:68-514(-)|eukprot:CAMPEP_0168529622 /NCGR_PEP_ID=MMETSP0405-20121227/14042_1 /TAXON_ID=498012 /ORGANISM="Trichosphaerium sp, Strain Am-I-7 wt" /LENGTH=148 /DNA_ID=CAMNT_0008553429 /DNA_START=46 /DNA_END=492 /DNA_ORIENTATION=-
MSEGAAPKTLFKKRKPKKRKLRERRQTDGDDDEPQDIQALVEETKLVQQVRQRAKGTNFNETQKTDEEQINNKPLHQFTSLLPGANMPAALESKMNEYIETEIQKKRRKTEDGYVEVGDAKVEDSTVDNNNDEQNVTGDGVQEKEKSS